jgi:hypothetical protein
VYDIAGKTYEHGDEAMTSIDETKATPFYHGTRADLKTGDLIAAGHASNYGARKQASWVYLSATLDAAIWGQNWPLAMAAKESTSSSRPARSSTTPI